MKKEITGYKLIAIALICFAMIAITLYVDNQNDKSVNMTEYRGEPGECTAAYINEDVTQP